MGRRFNTREGQTFFFFFTCYVYSFFLFLFFGSVRDMALFSYCYYWKCLEICFQLLKFVRQAHFKEEGNAEPGYEVWCWYLWTWRNNITSHFKIVTHLLVISKLWSQISWKVFRLVFSAIAVEINLTDTVVVVSYVRRYKMSEIQPRKGIILHTKSLENKQKNAIFNFNAIWYSMMKNDSTRKFR